MSSDRQIRALSVDNILNYKPDIVEFDGEWLDSFGQPEVKGSWLIWGGSGSGKSSLAMRLAKYFCRFRKVVYDSIEEGMSATFKQRVVRYNMKSVNKNFTCLNRCDYDDLVVFLDRRKSAQVVIVDSVQYLTSEGVHITDLQYKELVNRFPRKLFIFVSHANGAEPRGNLASSILYDANVKVYVKELRATVQSRYGGGEPFVISEKIVRERCLNSY